MQSIHELKIEPFPRITIVGAVGCQQGQYRVFKQSIVYSMAITPLLFFKRSVSPIQSTMDRAVNHVF